MGLPRGRRPGDAYNEVQPRLKELPTVDRCFKLVGPPMTVAGVRDNLRRLRKVYTDMLDVIMRNTLTTPKDEKTGARRFIHVVTDRHMKQIFGPKSAIADAETGGWWHKNANLSNIEFNEDHIDDGDGITSLIHEMSHFVSHPSSFMIGQHHAGGLYNGAFNDNHFQAVRNSFCYEWYSFLASFKHQRSTPNSGLVLT